VKGKTLAVVDALDESGHPKAPAVKSAVLRWQRLAPLDHLDGILERVAEFTQTMVRQR
jgi:hypothetical protein